MLLDPTYHAQRGERIAPARNGGPCRHHRLLSGCRGRQQEREETMIRRTFWSIVAITLACSAATAADIRRVVTGLDANNKAVALFDGKLTPSPGGSGNPAANPWITESSPPGFSYKDDHAG